MGRSASVSSYAGLWIASIAVLVSMDKKWTRISKVDKDLLGVIKQLVGPLS